MQLQVKTRAVLQLTQVYLSQQKKQKDQEKERDRSTLKAQPQQSSKHDVFSFLTPRWSVANTIYTSLIAHVQEDVFGQYLAHV